MNYGTIGSRNTWNHNLNQDSLIASRTLRSKQWTSDPTNVFSEIWIWKCRQQIDSQAHCVKHYINADKKMTSTLMKYQTRFGSTTA